MAIVTRTDAAALIPEEVSRAILQDVPAQSAVMRLARRLPNGSRGQLRLPVLTGLITAGFVNGDTGKKPTSAPAWENKFIDYEELAVIVPIPEKVLDDSDYDLWGEIRPRIVEAMGAAFDAAVLHGVNAPSSWPEDLEDAAAAAGNTVSLAAFTDIFDAVMGPGGSLSLVEDDGYMITGHIAAMTMKARLRGLRDANGQPIFLTSLQERTRYALDGNPVEFPRNGAINAAAVLMFSGDWDQVVWSMRQDLTYKILTEATLTDGAGNILYSLAEQDMIALRAVMRLGWEVPNPVNRMNTTAATRFPIATLTP